MERIGISDFLDEAENLTLLDVRSPSEYTAGHIPGANSFPLFSDEERAIVGTSYKQEGRKAAVLNGLDIIGPKMRSMAESAEEFNTGKFAIHCWRGGMRSESMAWLLETCGFETIVLEGGYKAYRKHLIDFYTRKIPFKVLSGCTGSMKTVILGKLAEAGEQVLDLEGMAGHQGSSFGNKKSTWQPTTEQFQNNVFDSLRKMDFSKPVWIEDEDKRIGTVNMNDELFVLLGKSPHYVIEMRKEDRARFLVEDYSELSDEKLIEATKAISRRLGGKEAQEAIRLIQENDRKSAAEIILDYYDKRYLSSLEKKKSLVRKTISINPENLKPVVKELIKTR